MKHANALGGGFVVIIHFAASITQASEPPQDDFHENVLVSYAEYSEWPEKDRAQYMTEWRRAWTNFEMGIRQRGQSFAKLNGSFNLIRILMPEASSATPRMGHCLVGGWREEPSAEKLCSTRGHPCGDPADEGFECSVVYSNACVEREPIDTLSKRCAASAQETPLDRNQYDERRHLYEDLLHDCQTKAFPARFQDNCNLLLHDAHGIVEKFAQRSADLAQERDSKKPNAANDGQPAKYCENDRVIRIYKSYGGSDEIADASVRRAIRQGYRVEVVGRCLSACIHWPARVPKERVCIQPNASLGFHLYRYGSPNGPIDHTRTLEVLSRYHPEIREWLKDKRLGTDMTYLKGTELHKIYQSCDDLYAACRAQKGQSWKPAKRRPETVPEMIQ